MRIECNQRRRLVWSAVLGTAVGGTTYLVAHTFFGRIERIGVSGGVGLATGLSANLLLSYGPSPSVEASLPIVDQVPAPSWHTDAADNQEVSFRAQVEGRYQGGERYLGYVQPSSWRDKGYRGALAAVAHGDELFYPDLWELVEEPTSFDELWEMIARRRFMARFQILTPEGALPVSTIVFRRFLFLYGCTGIDLEANDLSYRMNLGRDGKYELEWGWYRFNLESEQTEFKPLASQAVREQGVTIRSFPAIVIDR